MKECRNRLTTVWSLCLLAGTVCSTILALLDPSQMLITPGSVSARFSRQNMSGGLVEATKSRSGCRVPRLGSIGTMWELLTIVHLHL